MQNPYDHPYGMGHGLLPAGQVYVAVPPPATMQPRPINTGAEPDSRMNEFTYSNVSSSYNAFGHHTPLQTVTQTAPFIMPQLPVDFRLMLLKLSEQYVNAARSMNSCIAKAHTPGPQQLEHYHKLMAAGLACLEAVITNSQWRRSPREDAVLQLRYAMLLFDETDNYDEAESILSKGVSQCDRNRLLNLKYSMQHLLVRVLFKSKPKAAFKYLDNAIGECTTSGQVPWIFSFSFLKVSLLSAQQSVTSMIVALQNLRDLIDVAGRTRETNVCALASIIAAAIHLRIRSPDSRVEAQRHLASARARLSGTEGEGTFQLSALVHLLDLACCLDSGEGEAAKAKMHEMQAFLDQTSKNKAWRNSETFALPLVASVPGPIADGAGIFTETSNRQAGLLVTWMRSTDTYPLGFLFSAAAEYLRDRGGGQKFHLYIQEGLRLVEDVRPGQETAPYASLAVQLSRTAQSRRVKCQMLMVKAFASFESSDLATTVSAFDDFAKHIDLLPKSDAAPFLLLSKYLVAMFHQSQGRFDEATKDYSHLIKACSVTGAETHRGLHDQLCALSRLNILLILRCTFQPSDFLIQGYVDQLKSVFESPTPPSMASLASNPHLQSAYNLARATMPHVSDNTTSTTCDNSPTIRPTKARLQRCISLANGVGNRQILTMALCYMNTTFFSGIIGEQALQAARSARECAKQVKSAMWKAVASGMLSDTLEKEGRMEEALKMRNEAETFGARMPEVLRRA